MTKAKAAVLGMTAMVLGTLVLAAPGWAHSVATKDAKLSEADLRRVEARLLGPEHAADHARQRARARAERARLARLTPAQRRAERRRATVRARASDVSSDGRWNGSSKLPMSATHTVMLPTGKVLMFAQPGNQGNDENEGRAYLYDPANGSTKEVRPPVVDGKPANIWCAGQTLMADGQVLVTGGNLRYQTGTKEDGLSFAGLDQIYTFDPWSESWTRQPDMEHGRWYPTQTLLPDGRTLIVGGWDESGREIDVPDIEVFTPAGQRGGRGSLARYPGYGDIGGLPTRPSLYPHMFLMPNGQVAGAGPRTVESFLLDVPRGGTPSARGLSTFGVRHEYGSSVLVPQGPEGSSEVMQVGGYRASGRDGSVARSEKLDTAANRVSEGPALRTARAHHNVILLPDRSMVAVGGGVGDVDGDKWVAEDRHKTIEILDRGASEWRLGPAQTQKRSYHSTALLLPDGRVLSAGDESDATSDAVDIAEVYEPAYLHKGGDRPQITGAPDATEWNRGFSISTSTGIDDAVLIAPGAVTHANDMSQRLVPLKVAPKNGGADLIAPPNANVAPPGFYMLFALKNGKPSVAHWIYLGAGSAPANSPTPTSNRPVQAPAPTPAPAPQPAAPVPGPVGGKPAKRRLRVDPGSPKARLRVSRLPSRKTLARRGRLTVRISLSEAGRVRLIPRIGNTRLTAAGKTRTVTFRRKGARRITVVLSRTARTRLLRSSKVKLELFTSARDRRNNVREQRWVRRLR